MKTQMVTKKRVFTKTAHLSKADLPFSVQTKFIILEMEFMTTMRNSITLLISILKEVAEQIGYLVTI